MWGMSFEDAWDVDGPRVQPVGSGPGRLGFYGPGVSGMIKKR